MTGPARVGIAQMHPREFERGLSGGTFRRRRPDPQPVDVEGVKWVCVLVRPRTQFTVADGLRGAGFRVFCPHGVRVQLRAPLGKNANGGVRRGARDREYPVFGSYLFVGEPPGLIVARESHWHILDVLENAGSRYVPSGFIAACSELWCGGRWDDRGKSPFRPGAWVSPSEGPFRGIASMIESLPTESRAVIRFALFGRQTRVTVDVSKLALV